MMESMTGYASLEKTTEQFSFSISIRSLNTKYLEIYTNLPRILKDDTVEIESLLKERFVRGKIELNVDFFDWVDYRKSVINRGVIKKYYDELREVEHHLGIKDSFNLSMLLSMDGVVQRERTVLSEKTRKEIYDSLEAVIRKAIQMRRKEGASVKKDLKASLTAINRSLAEIKKLSKNSIQVIYNRLKDAVESVSQHPVKDDRLYSEIAILADKLDINEEKMRLADHIKKFTQVMNEEGQIGKQLDFLAQEMFREINTIASKSSNSRISHLVVDMKNHIDKIREQCRNII